MAQNPFSLLLLKRLALASRNPKPPLPPLSLFISHLFTTPTSKPFSTSETSPTPSTSSPSEPKPSSLSARMSFIFDQIDAIEKERSQKDQTLQRIRAWRESKKSQNPPVDSQNPEFEFQSIGDGEIAINAGRELNLDESTGSEVIKKKKKEVELIHPWPEWIELMERLVQQNYFDHRRKDEDKMVQELGFDVSGIGVEDDVGFDFTKDFKAVQIACLNFGKDRFDILRSLSRQDLQILVGFGCPSADKKVVFSAKLLRKLVHLDEGDVCSSCSLRNSCERAYLVTNKEDEARTIDVMRVLLTYGFDPMNGSVVNDSLLKQKSVKTVVRKLLHQVCKLSSVPIDPNLPPPVIKKPPPKVKQPPPPPKKRVGRDDIEMKKGDWLCPKCDFMNFAKNAVCLQCDAKRPKRQLLPGEWECPECNFLNYRRNMVCFHCECKRPPDEFMENQMQEKRRGPRTRLEKIANRQEVSNAWNFDFDDDESDGADVAAFEYADSVMSGNVPLDNYQAGENIGGGFEGNVNKLGRNLQEKEFSDSNNRPRMGFDDFEDEESDIDSYEPDTPNNSNSARKTSSIDFSDLEGDSDSEDIEVSKRGSRSNNKKSENLHRRAAFSGSADDDLDSDEELSVHRNWRSSHVAASRSRNSGRNGLGSLSSDEDSDFDENFGSRQRKGNGSDPGRRNFRRRGSSDLEDDLSGLDFGKHDRHSSHRLRGTQRENDRKGYNSKAHGNYKNTRDEGFRSNMSSRQTQGTNRRFKGNDRVGGRTNDRGYDMKGPKGGFRKQQKGRYNEYDTGKDQDYGEFRNSRRVIER